MLPTDALLKQMLLQIK